MGLGSKVSSGESLAILKYPANSSESGRQYEAQRLHLSKSNIHGHMLKRLDVHNDLLGRPAQPAMRGRNMVGKFHAQILKRLGARNYLIPQLPRYVTQRVNTMELHTHARQPKRRDVQNHLAVRLTPTAM